MRAQYCVLTGVLLLMLAGCGPNPEGPAPVMMGGSGVSRWPGGPFGGACAPGRPRPGGVEKRPRLAHGGGATRPRGRRRRPRVFRVRPLRHLAGSAAILERQAEWLKRYPQIGVTIEGHTDERGTREYNLSLGERRAQAVKNVLVALGIPAARIETISYGKERPVIVHSDEQSFAQNRRGVTVVR